MTVIRSFHKKSTLWLASFVFGCLMFTTGVSAQTPNTVAKQVTPEMLSASFVEVAKRVEAAVVNIDTKGKVPEVATKGERPEGNLEDLLDFLRRQQRRPSAAVGSGFIVDRSGYILTNYHVVEDSSRITVRLHSGEEFQAKIIGMDEETDLAVLKIDTGRDLPFVKLADSSRAQVGDWVLAIGSPFGLAQTVTAGIISQTNRETPYATPFQKFIQTDAAINRGNSGGPLVNMDGEVIGVNSQIATSTGDYNGVGFALPSNEAGYVYQQILQNGKVRRGFLGVLLDSVKAEYAKVYGLPEAKGAIITEVRDKQSAAANGGLLAGDVIIEFDGKQISNAQDLITKVSSTTPERNVGIVFLRENGTQLERKTTSIKLGERPSNNSVASNDDTPKKLPVNSQREQPKPLGLTVVELTPQLIEMYKLESNKGLLVKEINPASFIADVKLSNGNEALGEGDLIQRINRIPVTDLKTFNEVAGKLKTGDAVVLHVLSNNRLSRSPQVKIVQFTVQ
ncbi:MAG TPA: trypsin-like peptidase domain-containing protein [Pyrinomonadaceae bacterium]|nr:trypsin-like peptidase domain-containing protein [Pyrinomonadaceae bacterium]